MHLTQSDQWAKFRLETPNVKKVIDYHGVKIYFHQIPFLPLTIAYIPRADVKINDELKKVCAGAIYIKVEPLTGSGGTGKPILPQHTIYVDLAKIDLNMMHEKTRYNIRLAEKKGVIVKQDNNPENFIELLEKTEKRQGFYSHYPNYYRKLWEIIKPIILTAYVDEKPVASIALIKYEDVLYYPYGGSDPAYKEYMAPHLLHWEAIKLGKKLGCKIYDFWGSYKYEKSEKDPWWGIYRFKSGFGGYEVDFPQAIDIPLSPLYPLFSLLDSLRWKILKTLR
jgi:lipid II:glycine glycyltransferase (peptidoglycan interpeptide bridge formation enzyme)